MKEKLIERTSKEGIPVCTIEGALQNSGIHDAAVGLSHLPYIDCERNYVYRRACGSREMGTRMWMHFEPDKYVSVGNMLHNLYEEDFGGVIDGLGEFGRDLISNPGKIHPLLSIGMGIGRDGQEQRKIGYQLVFSEKTGARVFVVEPQTYEPNLYVYPQRVDDFIKGKGPDPSLMILTVFGNTRLSSFFLPERGLFVPEVDDFGNIVGAYDVEYSGTGSAGSRHPRNIVTTIGWFSQKLKDHHGITGSA